MSDKYSDDADWATAAEQSSEEDESQEGNVLAEQEQSSSAAEHNALHIEGDGEIDVEYDDTDDIEIEDPEADAIVNDALNLDEAAESEAAAEVLTDAKLGHDDETIVRRIDRLSPFEPGWLDRSQLLTAAITIQH